MVPVPLGFAGSSPTYRPKYGIINIMESLYNTTIPYGYVYQIKNTVNGKTYIGLRKLSRDNSWRGYMGSGVLIKQAIDKYGKEKFIKSFLGYAYSQEELYKLEKILIEDAKSKGKADYNLAIHTPYSDKYHISGKSKQLLWSKRISESIKKIHANPDYKHTSSIAFEMRYDKFCEMHSREIIMKSYLEVGSMQKLAKSLNVSKRLITKYLKDNELMNPPRNSYGTKRTQEERDAISASIRSKIGLDSDSRNTCINCDKKLGKKTKSGKCRECFYALQDKEKRVILAVIQLEEKLSIREISRRTGLSRNKVNKFLNLK